ncbi:MAG: (2Fe-2S)-binding protein [Mycobacterium sp.]|nr:(2Fe-2S)-binding protein [Mycobacterium sp.]
MYVCLCSGATRDAVAHAVANGASTCRKVADACGAGLDCGRCLRNLKAIIESESAEPAALSTVAG